MEWMRCNSCWLKVENKQSLFCLTQCGHLYCNKCIQKAEKKCFQCNSVGTISLSLKEPLNPLIDHYFTRIPDLIEKVLQAEQFQESQMSLCLQRSDAIESKYQSAKEAYWTTAERIKVLSQKYNNLKMAINKRQKELENSTLNLNMSKYQTPPTKMSCQSNLSSRSFERNGQNMAVDDEVFRVPSVTRVPRSANHTRSTGYYTASSTMSSNLSQRSFNTSNSNLNRY